VKACREEGQEHIIPLGEENNCSPSGVSVGTV